ncbi:MAG: hypothetical protein GXX92_11625 [Clostridiales bacterium]|nr:hypothetical protein [Clostridiales bacterium]
MCVVLRFQNTNRLAFAVSDAYQRTVPEQEIPALAENIHLLRNGDLYISDACDPELVGIFLQSLRAHGFLQEDAEAIHLGLV